MADPVTIITGASGALGSALTELLLERGHRVAAVDLDVARLAALAAKNAGRMVALALNAKDASAWPALMARVESNLGVPTGAVLIAGGWAGGSPVASEKDDSAYRRMLELNLDSARAALAAILPTMVAAQGGSIVVIGSRAVERPWESQGAAAYAAAKSALVAYAQVIAAETREQGVRVNAVLPSTLDTPANRAGMPTADFSRWVAPRSLSAVIAFLLSEDARDVSGAAIPVYGRA